MAPEGMRWGLFARQPGLATEKGFDPQEQLGNVVKLGLLLRAQSV
jgi:hypothetical protein